MGRKEAKEMGKKEKNDKEEERKEIWTGKLSPEYHSMRK